MPTKQREKNEPDTDAPVVFGEKAQAEERRSRPARERQFPSLYGKPDVEVAERTADTSEESTGQHVKDFVTTREQWDSANQDEQHKANINAVRQYMLANGLRPDADVEFEGEHDHPFDPKSIVLRYGVSAVPAAVAVDFDLRHAVVVQDGPTPTERAEHDAGREARLAAGHDALREGTPEADRTKAAEKDEQKPEK